MSLRAARIALNTSVLGFGLITAPAFAQTAMSAGEPAQTASADTNAQDDGTASTADIVVTGSLIQRANGTSVSPVVSVSTESIKQSGTPSLTDVLNQFPGFTAAGNGSTGGFGAGGRATMNLHGLGSNRNLVLLDGRRLPVSDINGNVDINILPQAIIGGVDVITGGASAVYGSDAISGVVNFKSIRKLEGLHVDAQNSISQRGDNYRFDGSVAGGFSFADDRGHLIGSVSYTKQDPVSGKDRRFFHDKIPSSFVGTGTYVPSATNAPSAAAVQTVFANYGVTGARNPLLNLGFNNDGSLYVQTGAVNYRGPTDANGYLLVNGNVRMPAAQQQDFMNALDRKVAFAKADFEITPSLTAYAQGMYVDLTVKTGGGGSLTQFGNLTTIAANNPFIPQDVDFH